MTEEEAHKINELFKQIDTLTTENNALKAAAAHDHGSLETRLDSIEASLQKLTGKVK
tara:strand:- start:513 stop:683 length:171 start_codon:yes stop_codon:yes gene_type:complete